MDREALATAFDASLARLGTSLSHDDLLRRYAKAPASLPPRSLEDCAFWELFQAAPQALNAQYDAARAEARRVHGDAFVDAILKAPTHHALKARRSGDYRLDQQQQRALAAHGVTLVPDGEGRRARSFGALFNDLYQDDMPVFVSADAVLHAWHMSFDAFYMDMEEASLKPLLQHVLEKTLRQVDALAGAHQGDALLAPLVTDVHDVLAVALSLLQGKIVAGATKRVESLWRATQAKQVVQVELFGTRRTIDFSQLEPRGHYTKTHGLKLYFGAFMWLALCELRIDGTGDAGSDMRQLRVACCVVQLLRAADVADVLAAYERTLDALVGSGYGPDALTPRTLDEMLPSDFRLEDVRDAAWCVALQQKIRASGAATQLVNAQLREEARTRGATPLPAVFCFFGQYAAWDAFAMSRVVFDRVRHGDAKVVRSLPSAVDVAFAVMGNDAASHVLAKRMAAKPDDPDFAGFRDGLPYASNLIALREVLDQETARVDPSDASLVTLWMLALRELSKPAAHEDAGLQTQTWNLRTMNAQIGSYMQLKHDTVLTAKQSVSLMGGCSHPAAFVDPYPDFWDKMAQLATRCAALSREMNQLGSSWTREYPKMDRMVEFFFANFAEVMRKLKAVTVAQANHLELTEEQDKFLKAVMEGHRASGPSRFEGWYPGLFYRSASQSVDNENQVIDIFTNPPSPERADPGGVLHLQVSHGELCAVVVDNTMYAGPIFRHSEFVAPAGTRYVHGWDVPGKLCKRPEWVRDSFAAAIQ